MQVGTAVFQHYVQLVSVLNKRNSAGGELPDGWDCRMRFRVTNRRNGRLGRTTDNVSRAALGLRPLSQQLQPVLA